VERAKRLSGAVRKSVLALLLTVVSSSATAEWVQIISAETYIAYADLATIRREQNRVKMWKLIDYKTATIPFGGKRYLYLSSKSQEEYDCMEERMRVTFFSWHSKNMGSGKMVYSKSKPGMWEPIASENIQNASFKLACG
jgi:hypothetical protein